MYALILDDRGEGLTRHQARARVDDALARPLDEQEAEEYDRERWGLGDDAVRAAAAKDAMFGGATYE